MILVIFDVDGTLIDSRDIILAAQRAAFEAHGIAVPEPRRALSIVGLSLPLAFEVLAGKDAPIEQLCETYKVAFARLRNDKVHEEPLFPGAGDVLRRLRARPDVKLGIATGKMRRGIDHLVAVHGWADLFDTIQTADDVPSKPDPTMIRQAMAQTGIAAERSVMIGDTTYDIEMAGRAGCRALGVGWGHHDAHELTKAGAERVLISFDHLIDAVDDMMAPKAAHS